MKSGWKFGMLMAVVLGLLLCVSAARAEDKPPKPKVIEGTISKVDATNAASPSISVKPAKGDAVVVATDASTVVKIGDATKAFADLAVGQKVRVVMNADGTIAASITVRKAPAPRKG